MHWYLLALLVLTYLFNNISLHYGFDNLSYRMELPDELFEIGAEIPISSVVENRKPLTVSFLQVREWFPPYFDIKHNTYSLFIMPFQRVRRTYKVRALKRGLYSLDKVELKLGDFIGLRSEEKRIPTGPRLVVLPARANLDRDIVPLGALSGEVTVRRWLVDDPLMTVGIREYTGAEPRKYLHWPSSLRHGKLMVKEFDYTTDNSAMLLLNMETMKPVGSRWRKSCWSRAFPWPAPSWSCWRRPGFLRLLPAMPITTPWSAGLHTRRVWAPTTCGPF